METTGRLLRRLGLAGVFLAVQLGAANTGSGEDIQSSMKMFTRVLNAVEANFADTVDTEKAIYDGAIPGMLRTLDPHSSFFDPKELQRFREGQKGHYFGVGMVVGWTNGHVTVMNPFQGSPAKKAGLRPGDQIFMVDDKNTEKATVEDVVVKLKGPRGTPVQVAVKRQGVDKLITFNLIRDQVARPSVPTAVWVKPGVAYIHIESFNENTSREFEGELKRLGEEKVEGLIIDVRDNPGGILQEAVAISDRFLERGQAIVSQRGRISTERAYSARRGNAGRKYPIVVMVNRNSASAAEILSGALQDHDRAWIIGDNTFGKGLVQAPYPLSADCQLLLTIARFYTPSGRLIQRDYSKGTFFDYYYKQNTATRNARDQKMTDSGRVVFGGGGIAPDEKHELEKLNRTQQQLLGRRAFLFFANQYFASQTEPSLPEEWDVDEATLTKFKQYLKTREISVDDKDLQANIDWIKRELRVEMFVTAAGRERADEVKATIDPDVLRAVDAMPRARALLEKARKMVAERKRPAR
ncbi:MAG: S41 family peptidase [Bryobacteraceae bacterium]|nr:S41 family peptidase [Bryobacteraceae bacterium]